MRQQHDPATVNYSNIKLEANALTRSVHLYQRLIEAWLWFWIVISDLESFAGIFVDKSQHNEELDLCVDGCGDSAVSSTVYLRIKLDL